MYWPNRDVVSRFLPVLISVLMTFYSYLGFDLGVIEYFFLAVFILVFPGYYVSYRLSSEHSLSLDEFVVLCMVFSGIVLMFSYLVLTQLFGNVTQFMIYSALTIFLIITGVLHTVTSDEIEFSFDGKPVLGLVGLSTSFFIGVLVSSLYMPPDYWRGPDGWENVNVISIISELSLSHSEAFEFFRPYVVLSNPGFYHYFSAFHLATGVSVESIMRYGGLIQSGLFISLAYVLFKRLNGVVPGLAGAFLLSLNPFYNHRFMVLLREDFSLLFMFAGLFLYEACRGSGDKLSALRIVALAGVVSACLVSHPMTPVILFGVFLYQLVSLRMEKNHIDFLQILLALFLGALFSFPFSTNMTVPMLNFVSKVSYRTMFLALIPFSVVIVVIYFARNLGDNLDNIYEGLVKVLGFFMIVPPVLGVVFRPSFGYTFDFSYIELDHFSRILVPFSIAGYFLFYLGSKKRLIVGLNLVVSFLIAISYFGVPVPLGRLSVPLSWLMSFYASYLVSASMWVSFRGAESVGQGSGLVSHLLDHRMTLVFMLMILAGGVLELSDVTRKQSIFDASDVADTRLFVSELEPDELVFPYGISDHMLYYAGISRGNIVADLGVKQELLGLLDHDPVYEVSDLVQENYPDVGALVFYVDSWDEYSLREKPFGRLLDMYFERTVYGDFSSYRLEMPFTVEKLKMDQIEYVEDLPGDPILGSRGDIVSISNCVAFSDGGAPNNFLFRAVSDGSQFIGLASSPDGVAWSVEHEDPLGYELESLSLVEHDGLYYLYAGTSSKDKVVRLESRDLRHWGNYTVVIDSSSREGLVFIESPRVWHEAGGLGMLWWETTVGDSMMNGVHYATSADGVNWETNPEPLGWVLMDTRYRVITYDKILPCALVRSGDGVTVLARMHVANATFSMSWATGSISLEDVTSKAAGVRCFVYKDHLGLGMDSVHVMGDVEGSGLRFIYLEDGGGRVFIGTASDHLGLEADYLARP